MEMKSLAHPDWPYAGTAHEWRGFVKDESQHVRTVKIIRDENGIAIDTVYQKQDFGPNLT